jgi:hypothetical protein
MVLLISPALGLILGFFCKYASGTLENPKKYLFIDNINLPVYLFMSVISALFVGMIISAEEIHMDRKIREREKFISLSNVSYINSKVLFLFMISAIQIFLFVLVGNSILQIKGMGLLYVLILFSTSCCANMIGLIFSSAFKSLVAIYILIPLMLVPLILLSGVIVPFDRLSNSMKSEKYVPHIGDMMVSRWAYEALAVAQFRSNDYQQYWFDIEQRKSSISYLQNNLITVVSNLTVDIRKEIKEAKLINLDVKELNSGLNELNKKIRNPNYILLSAKNITVSKLNEIDNYLDNSRLFLSKQMDEIKNIKISIYDNLLKKFGNDEKAMLEFKEQYYNNGLADNVLRKNEYKKLIVENGEIIRKFEPIYYEPENSYGRAHFYAPDKKIGTLLINTFNFNMAVLWIISLLLYIVLITDILKKLINYLILKT